MTQQTRSVVDWSSDCVPKNSSDGDVCHFDPFWPKIERNWWVLWPNDKRSTAISIRQRASHCGEPAIPLLVKGKRFFYCSPLVGGFSYCISSMVGLVTQLSCGEIPMKALCCRKRHGWFLVWPPCHETRKWCWKQVEKGSSFVTGKSMSVLTDISTATEASSLDCPLCGVDSPPVSKFN